MDIPGSCTPAARLAPSPNCVALSFVNTLQPQEQLCSYSDILNWGLASGVLSSEREKILRDISDKNSARGLQVLSFARNMRTVISQALRMALDPNYDQYHALEEMNTLLCSLPLRRLSKDPGGYSLVWAEDHRALDQMLHDPLLDAARLLCALDQSWLGVCQSASCIEKYHCTRRDVSATFLNCPDCSEPFTLLR
jgi:hypothetical protein